MIKQNPFSLYDFLGYFIPGALLFYLILFIENFKNSSTDFKFWDLLKNKTDFQFEQFLFFIIISYSLGHLINFISSITIEKYAILKYDYPSKYLLNLEIREYWTKGLSISNLWKLILLVLILPVTVFDLILGDIFKFKNFYTRKLDSFLIVVITEKGNVLINKLFKYKSGNEEVKNVGIRFL